MRRALSLDATSKASPSAPLSSWTATVVHEAEIRFTSCSTPKPDCSKTSRCRPTTAQSLAAGGAMVSVPVYTATGAPLPTSVGASASASSRTEPPRRWPRRGIPSAPSLGALLSLLCATAAGASVAALQQHQGAQPPSE